MTDFSSGVLGKTPKPIQAAVRGIQLMQKRTDISRAVFGSDYSIS